MTERYPTPIQHASDRAVLSAADRARQIGLTKEEAEAAFLAARNCGNGGPKPETIIKRTGAHWRRQIQLLQLVWRIHESGGEGVMAVTEATEKLRAAIRGHLKEHPLATAEEVRKALQDAGVEIGSRSSFDGYHVPAVRRALGIDGRDVTVAANGGAPKRKGPAKRTGAAPKAPRREERSEEPEGAEPPAAADEAPAPPPAAPSAGSGPSDEVEKAATATDPNKRSVEVEGKSQAKGRRDEGFDAAAHAREIVGKTTPPADQASRIFYGAKGPDVAEAAAAVGCAFEALCLEAHDGDWLRWYMDDPDGVLALLRLRVALRMDVPEAFAPLMALGREAA